MGGEGLILPPGRNRKKFRCYLAKPHRNQTETAPKPAILLGLPHFVVRAKPRRNGGFVVRAKPSETSELLGRKRNRNHEKGSTETTTGAFRPVVSVPRPSLLQLTTAPGRPGRMFAATSVRAIVC